MTSLWLDRPRVDYSTEFVPDRQCDVVVVGAGMTGVVTALLCARTGCEVILLEARTAGAVTTGNTTGKLSLLQGTRLSGIAKKHSPSVVRAYVDANREGQQWLLRYCTDNSVPFQRRSAFTYTVEDRGTRSLEAELDAARVAGIDVRWTETVELPFPVAGALRLDDQAQFDAVDVVDALLKEFTERGGVLNEHTRVHTVRGDRNRRSVHTECGVVTASAVVLATGTPILDRGGFFARVEAQRSYCASFAVPGPVPNGMYLSVDSPSRSLRYAPSRHDDLLVVGGNGHSVGRTPSPAAHLRELVEWTQRTFPGAIPTHSWSAQDYKPVNELPYVGELVPGDRSILVATGYAKWGLTNAVAAAIALVSTIFGGRTDWAAAYSPWDWNQLAGIPGAVRANGEVAVEMTRGWIRPLINRLTRREKLSNGKGEVVWEGLRPSARCEVDGVAHRLSAVCPHLGGVLRWNDSEHTWDCPLHGSRFAAGGALLEGPATSDMS